MYSSADNTPLYRHKRPHIELIRRHRAHWGTRETLYQTLFGIAAFIGSLIVEYFAIAYATASVSNPVTDLVLSNIPIFDVDGLFIYGMFLLIAFITLLCLTHPKRAPYTLYALALFYLIRGFFVTLTHVAPYPIPYAPDFGTTITKIFFGGDLFFSGHTGAPFMMALLYWREKFLRYLFLIWSVFFAIVVLMGHYHYSIDVASAYFITYTIYCMVEYLFPKARAHFYSDPITLKA